MAERVSIKFRTHMGQPLSQIPCGFVGRIGFLLHDHVSGVQSVSVNMVVIPVYSSPIRMAS